MVGRTFPLILLAGATLWLSPAVKAETDSSPCSSAVRQMGYTIKDIDNEKDVDEFEVIKDGKAYKLDVQRKGCKLLRQRPYND